MKTITNATVTIQTTSPSLPSGPCWCGDVVISAPSLQRIGVLAKRSERVCFARRRFGHAEVSGVLAVLFGSAVSGERTREAFSTHLHPLAMAFLTLFGRERLPAHATRSRFVAV
jgi:hypothetical protein